MEGLIPHPAASGASTSPSFGTEPACPCVVARKASSASACVDVPLHPATLWCVEPRVTISECQVPSFASELLGETNTPGWFKCRTHPRGDSATKNKATDGCMASRFKQEQHRRWGRHPLVSSTQISRTGLQGLQW